jgi:hypothetical protein
MYDHDLFKNYKMQELLDELDVIEALSSQGVSTASVR